MKAIFNGTVIAESDDTVVVEGNHYFPASSLVREHFSDSDHSTHCPWKGDASYYHVEVDGQVSKNGAWFYPETLEKAENIKGRVAFWNGIEVSE